MAPMRGAHLDAMPPFRFDPAVHNPAAWENQRVHAVVTDDGEFELAIKRRRGDWLPTILLFRTHLLSDAPAGKSSLN